MEKTEITSNEAEQKPKIDVQKVLNDYSIDELKYQACENHLLGNFDENKNYKILDIIYPELVKLNKHITERTTEYYTAYAVVHQVKLQFKVSIQRLENSKIEATLSLEEKIVVGKIYEHTISTKVKSIEDNDTPNFLQRVREEFHLKSEEDDEQSLLDEYISPPIELVTELIKKQQLLTAYQSARESAETDYINQIMTQLKQTEAGQALARTFFEIVKVNKLHTLKENKLHIFKQVLDHLIDEQISQNLMAEPLVNIIAEIRQEYLIKSQQQVYENIVAPPAKPKEQTVEVEKPKVVKSLPKEQPKEVEKPKPQPEKSHTSEKEPPKPEPKFATTTSSIDPPKPLPKITQAKRPDVRPKPKKSEKVPLTSQGVKVPPIQKAGFSDSIWKRASEAEYNHEPGIEPVPDAVIIQKTIIIEEEMTLE